MLQQEFIFASAECIENKTNNLYLHTDKTYYRAGSIVFFQTYLSSPNSGIVDIDLINQDGEVVLYQHIEVTVGRGAGSMQLNPRFPTGIYLLRAHTPSLRKKGSASFFRKAIFIQGVQAVSETIITSTQQRENTEQEEEEADIFIDISMDKESYYPLEKAQLEIDIYDEEGESIPANLSIAIVKQSFAPLQTDITNCFDSSKEDKESKSIALEKSFSLSGRVTEKGKPTKGVKAHGNLSALSNLLSMTDFETDEDGYFVIPNLSTRGVQDMLIQAAKGSSKKSSKAAQKGTVTLKGNRNVDIYLDTFPMVKVDQYDFAAMKDFKVNSAVVTALDNWTSASPTIQEDWDETLSVDLDEVVVKEKRLDQQIEHYKEGMLYKKPNIRIKTMTMPTLHQYRNIYDLLRGRVPGMKLENPEEAGMQHSIILRGRKTGLSNNIKMSNAAKFMVNGALVSTAYAEAIHPNDIAFVDVISSLDKLTPYGELGGNGLVMIYLKTAREGGASKTTTQGGVLHFTHTGFAIPKTFLSTDQTSSTTLFWHPSMEVNETGTAIIELLIGKEKGRYDVIVQGMSLSGVPLMAISTLIVE